MMQLRERVHLLDALSLEPYAEGYISGRSFCEPPMYDVTTDAGVIVRSHPSELVRSANGE